MNRFKVGFIFLAAMLAACASPQDTGRSALVTQQLAPTGKIRVAISVGPTTNLYRATVDPATGRLHGVPVNLANALGEKFGEPVELIAYTNYVDLLEAAARGAWDVTFVSFDQERTQVMDFGPAYSNFEFTYLVPDGSAIRNEADVDRPGVRIAVAAGSVAARNREQFLKNAVLVRFKTLAEVREQVRARTVDAAAAGRETLTGLAVQVPGARVLEGHFHVEAVAVAVPKNRPAALTYVSDFIETAKASGVVRKALDSAGFKDATVAPPAPRR